MDLTEGAIAAVVMFATIHLSGIMNEINILEGKLVIYIDRTEMYLHHEVQIAEDGLSCIDESYVEVVREAEQVVERLVS